MNVTHIKRFFTQPLPQLGSVLCLNQAMIESVKLGVGFLRA